MSKTTIGVTVLGLFLVLSMFSAFMSLAHRAQIAEENVRQLEVVLAQEQMHSYGCFKERGMVESRQKRLADYQRDLASGLIHLPEFEPGPLDMYTMMVDWAQEDYEECMNFGSL